MRMSRAALAGFEASRSARRFDDDQVRALVSQYGPDATYYLRTDRYGPILLVRWSHNTDVFRREEGRWVWAGSGPRGTLHGLGDGRVREAGRRAVRRTRDFVSTVPGAFLVGMFGSLAANLFTGGRVGIGYRSSIQR